MYEYVDKRSRKPEGQWRTQDTERRQTNTQHRKLRCTTRTPPKTLLEKSNNNWIYDYKRITDDTATVCYCTICHLEQNYFASIKYVLMRHYNNYQWGKLIYNKKL